MLEKAARGIEAMPGIEIRAASQVYLTEPQDYLPQPWFANQVLEIALKRPLSPQALLERFLRLETALGRRRDPQLRFGPRVIDIDLLLYGERTSDGFCELPHPRMLRRAFVLYPLSKIAPELVIEGKSVGAWLDGLDFRLEGNKIWQGNEMASD